jgi:transcriptional regulator NrdR family protein
MMGEPMSREGAGLRCPRCAGKFTAIIDTESDPKDRIRRRYRCLNTACDYRFTTREEIAAVKPVKTKIIVLRRAHG